MISVDLIRKQTDLVQEKLTCKGENISLDNLLKLDGEYREHLSKANDLRAERNKASEDIAKAKRAGENANEAISAMRSVGDEIKSLEEKAQSLKSEIDEHLLGIPNLPHDSVPTGEDASDNVEVRQWGTPLESDFELRDHLTLGENLGLFDFERGAKISGSGFPLYTGKGAKLERALINYMLDLQTEQHGYTEVFPPFMVRSDSPKTTGNLPKFGDDMYHTEKDELWLIPTAEVPVTNIHKDEILTESQLPINYAAYSACFRREAGSYGKDTRGFLRLHQFNKVELVTFVKPETSYDALEALVTHAEAILQSLELHYRVVELCAGDLSFSAAKCYDLEL